MIAGTTSDNAAKRAAALWRRFGRRDVLPWWRRAAGLIAAVAALAGAPSAAAQGRCAPPEQGGKVAIAIDRGRIDYDYSRSSEELAHLRQQIENKTFAGHPAGLTVSRMQYGVQTQTVLKPVRGGYCAYLRQANVTLGLAEVTVYVDRQYPVGHCEHRAVVEHEHEHVRINRRALDRAGAELRQRLQAAAAKAPGFYAPSKDEARNAPGRWVEELMRPTLAAAENDARQGNAAIDTPPSYRAVMRRCNRW